MHKPFVYSRIEVGLMLKFPIDAAYTSYAATPPPPLLCPICLLPLVYLLTVVPGARDSRLDYLECPSCGVFEYRGETHPLVSMQVNPARSVA